MAGGGVRLSLLFFALGVELRFGCQVGERAPYAGRLNGRRG